MAVIFTDLVDGQAVAAATFNGPLLALEQAILDARAGTGFNNQSANAVLAGPASGGAGAVSFRALVAADIPDLDAAKLTSGLLPVARGGTGAGTAAGAFAALAPVLAKGDLLAHDGTAPLRLEVGSEGQVLKVRAAADEGVAWEDPLAVLGDEEFLTISGGEITVTGGHHVVDTESAAASDDLDTILGLGNGDLVFVRATASGRTVVVKHGTGNIRLNGGVDFSLDNTQKGILFVGSGSYAIGVGVPVTVGAGSGTVTSININATAPLAATGGPITTSGTIDVELSDANANTVLAGPASGAADAPGFRLLVGDDIPALDAGKITTGAFDAARIPSLDASKISSGTLSTSRIPNLDASKINAGTFDVARIPTLTMSKISDRGLTTLSGWVKLGSTTSAINLTSISSSYRHLLIRIAARTSSGTLRDSLQLRFNDDAGNNYQWLGYRVQHSASVTSNEGNATAQIVFTLGLAGSTALAGAYGVFDIYVYNYADSTQHKHVLGSGMLQYGNTTGTAQVGQYSGLWQSNAVITKVTLTANGGDFLAGTWYSLYGFE